MTPDKELKPCPFCNGEVEIDISEGKEQITFSGKGRVLPDIYFIRCRNADHDVLVHGKSEQEVIQKWNTRADQSPPLPDDVRLAKGLVQSYDVAIKQDYGSDVWEAIETLIRAATQQPEVVTVKWKPIDEWHEDIGACFWTRFPIDEPYYAGSPLDEHWPEYHTHFIPMSVIGKDGLKTVEG